MSFNGDQKKALMAKLSHRHVKTRKDSGKSISYVEGWHVIAEANRIFGFDSWDRQTIAPHCIKSEVQRGQTVCLYSTKVRITVRAGATVTVREGIGTGFSRADLPEVSHEIALKAAETDATKRALSTFGSPFGLALYDPDKAEVTKPVNRRLPRPTSKAMALPPLVLKLENGQEVPFDRDVAFAIATLQEIARLSSVNVIYAFWTANLAAFTELRRRTDGKTDDPVQGIIDALKKRLRQVGLPVAGNGPKTATPDKLVESVPSNQQLLLPKEKRLRDRVHLEFVARQPCLVCGRRPAQAHHLRFAQPRAMAMKVSDEFAVPLCTTHHSNLHGTGDERAWWARHGIIEPLKFAARLWAASRNSGDDVLDEKNSTHQKPSDQPASPAPPVMKDDTAPAGE